MMRAYGRLQVSRVSDPARATGWDRRTVADVLAISRNKAVSVRTGGRAAGPNDNPGLRGVGSDPEEIGAPCGPESPPTYAA